MTLQQLIKSGLIEDNNLNDYTLRIHNEYKINSKHSLEFGGQLTKNEVDYNYSLNDSISVINQKDKGLIKKHFTFKINGVQPKKLNIIGGIRTTHFDVTNELYYEPRLSGSYQLNNKVKLKVAWGNIINL